MLRWITSARPAFDPVVAGQREGVAAITPGVELQIPLPSDLKLPAWASVSLRYSGERLWRPLFEDGIVEESDRVTIAIAAEERRLKAMRRDLHLRARVVSVQAVRRSAGRWEADTVPLADARLVLNPFESGAPPRDAPSIATGADGFAHFGPLPGEEWYADISASGHCPVRMLVPVYGRDDAPREIDLYLFPSVRKTRSIAVDGRLPPEGTTLRVSVECLHGVEIPTYYAVRPDGSFDVDEPLIGDVHYRVELPDGRRARLASLAGLQSDPMDPGIVIR